MNFWLKKRSGGPLEGFLSPARPSTGASPLTVLTSTASSLTVLLTLLTLLLPAHPVAPCWFAPPATTTPSTSISQSFHLISL